MASVDTITDYELQKECEEIAAEIFAEIFTDNDRARGMGPDDWESEMDDRAHEAADGHQFTIYTHKSLAICAHCNTDMGEEFIDDVGLPKPFTLASAASAVVYGEIRGRIMDRIRELIEDWEAPAGWYGDDEDDEETPEEAQA